MAAVFGRWWSSTLSVEDGKLIGFAKITRDMTEQRAAQLAVLESERRFRLLVQGVTDYAIYMLSPEGQVTNWNAGAERIKGYLDQKLSGSIFPASTHPRIVEAGVPEKALGIARREGRLRGRRVALPEGWQPFLGECGGRCHPR